MSKALRLILNQATRLDLSQWHIAFVLPGLHSSCRRALRQYPMPTAKVQLGRLLAV